MFDAKKMKAIGAMAARNARRAAETEDASANEVIDLAPLLKEWHEDAYESGAVRVYKGKPFKCVQAHDSTGNPSWNPEEAPSLWANYHGTDAAHALPYVQPTGAHDAYMNGEYAVWKDTVYLCTVNHTVHDPGTLPASWEAISP